MKDRVRQDIGAKEPLQDWASIDWSKVKKRVRNLRQRIYQKAQNGQWNQVRSLMKLMLGSYSNLLLSVRRVTQENRGKQTAGMDGQRALTSDERVALVHEMQQYTLWKVKPTRRVYIPKANGKRRPLGIATIKDRVAQAMVKNALEPCWEARFEANSYGFRPGRSCHDAIAQCHKRLRKGADTWALKADIRGAFDNISHRFILKTLGPIPGRALIRAWLKAGYVEAEMFHPTESGVPQGGIVSPLLTNVALDGLDELLASHKKVKCYTYTLTNGHQRVHQKASNRYGYIRYADDILVTAQTREDIEAIIPTLEDWLKERGLELNWEKTSIKHVGEGMNFLGFHIRQFHGRCYTMPQKQNVHALLAKIRTWLRSNIGASPAAVIYTLNAWLRGWGNYYRHGVSKRTFSYVDHHVFRALWWWAKKRHPNKGKRWMAQKYFMPKHNRARWTFHTMIETRQGRPKPLSLVLLSDIAIQRHVKVRGRASLDDPTLKAYWQHRRTRYGQVYWGKGSKLRRVAEKQQWRCRLCGEHLFNGEALQTHHKVALAEGGTNRADNLEHLHKVCHQHLHRMRTVSKPAKA